MRVKVHDFEGVTQFVEKYRNALQIAGCRRYKVYPRVGDEEEVLWLMEFDNHEAFHNSESYPGEGFVSLINPASEWDDAGWKLSLEEE